MANIIEILKSFVKPNVPAIPTGTDNEEAIYKSLTTELIDIERNIPKGGSQILNYEKDLQINVGMIVNDFPATRVDQEGEFRAKSVDVHENGTFKNHDTVPFVQELNTQNFPCGTYEIMAGNKYGITAGSGGIDIRTTGNSRFVASGRYTIVGSDELNVSSANNVNIKSGFNTTIEGDSITLKTSNQVLVDCNLGVAKNAIVNGSMMVDGELYINHITCPAEAQITGGGAGSFGQIIPNLNIGYADASAIFRALDIVLAELGLSMATLGYVSSDIPVVSLPNIAPKLMSTTNTLNAASTAKENTLFVYPHEHPFYNIPLTITDGNKAMRDSASGVFNSSSKLGIASPVSGGHKIPS